MSIPLTIRVAIARFRLIWRSNLIRVGVLLLIFLTVFLDSRVGTSIFTILTTSATAILPLHISMIWKQEQSLAEQVYSSDLDITSNVLGIFIAYMVAIICILVLCWIAGFPFSEGQGGGKRLLDGRILHMSTRGSFTLLSKVFFSTLTIIAMTILARRWIWLARAMVIIYWLYCFVLGGILGSYANIYGIEQGTFPTFFRIISFPPLAVNNIFAASWLPWVLPTLGFVLLCLTLAIWIQRRTQVGMPLITKPRTLVLVGMLGLAMFLVGEYYFVQFLREIYQGYF